MLLKFLCLSILILNLILYSISAQDLNTEKIQIDSISISGNYKTLTSVIKRELSFSKGDFVDSSILNYNRERIFSLGLFNRVVLTVVNKKQKNILKIIVKESWYIFALPVIETIGKSFSKAQYGLFILHKNFSGRNDKFFLKTAIGYDPYFLLAYSNPYIGKDGSYYYSISAKHQKKNNQSLLAKKLAEKEFVYKINSINFSFGKRISNYSMIISGIGFTNLSADFYKPLITISTKGKDNFLNVGLSYVYDSRDLIQSAETGFYFNIQYLKLGLIGSLNSNVIDMDVRNYLPLYKSIYIKNRLYVKTVFGKQIPYYQHAILGIGDFVRGHQNDIREGLAFILSSNEINIPIIKEWDLKFKLPLLPENLTEVRIGINVFCFFDTGSTFNNYKEIRKKNFYNGYGLGLQLLILPHNAWHFEYSFNEFGKGEITIGTGFSF